MALKIVHTDRITGETSFEADELRKVLCSERLAGTRV